MPILKLFIATWVVLLVSTTVLAQTDSIANLNLEEVQVNHYFRNKYSVGLQSITIDSISKALQDGGSLTNLLQAATPVYVKQDAGGLSTINIRGTGAERTAFLLGCININSLTLGQTNVSSVPVFLFDAITIQTGSSSSLFGSDAIGGTVQLETNPIWNKGLHVQVQQDAGSFHRYFSGIRIAYSNKNWYWAAKIYHLYNQNDFPFKTTVWDFDTKQFREDTTRNASIRDYGALGEIYRRLGTKSTLGITTWYEKAWHQIQPDIANNYFKTGFDQISDTYLRVLANYDWKGIYDNINIQSAYVSDCQLYNNNRNQTIGTRRGTGQAQYEHSFPFKGSVKVGANYTYILPKVYAYKDDLTEQRSDIYLSYSQQIGRSSRASVTMRKAYVSGFKTPVCPSLGMQYIIVSTTHINIKARGSIAQSYRVPSLNERYWVPGGNPNLKPEKGFSRELGLDYSYCSPRLQTTVSASGFWMDVDNWIYWVNKGMWQPDNAEKVQSKGIELFAKQEITVGKPRFAVTGSYIYNPVEQTASYVTSSVINSGQFMYTPMYVAQGSLQCTMAGITLVYGLGYTGKRLTEADKVLQAYTLMYASLQYLVKLKDHVISLSARVDNIGNRVYQNQENYAMPRRGYSVGVKYIY